MHYMLISFRLRVIHIVDFWYTNTTHYNLNETIINNNNNNKMNGNRLR